MKALVTGATGFVGSHVADKLIEKGVQVKCIARKSSNLRWLENKNVEICYASMDDKSALLAAVEDCDYVYHVAGLTFAKDLDEFMKGNRDATKNLISAVAEAAPNLKRFLYVSSQTVAGPAKSLEQPALECDTPNPLTSYAKSKLAGEQEVLKFVDKLPITIVRAPAVFGPRDTAILDIFKTVKMGLGTVIGFDEKRVSLIHSEDLSRGIILAAESENTKGEIYFVSSDVFYTWPVVLNQIKEAMGKKSMITLRLPHSLVLTLAGVSEFFGKFSSKPPVFNYEKGIDFIQKYWICSTEKAKRDFGYKQEVSIEEGVKITVDWYKKNGWL